MSWPPSIEDFERAYERRKALQDNRPEQHVMDDIDELIATELDEHGVPLDDYSKDRYVKCERCHDDWHGLPYNNCPGAWATQVESSKSVGVQAGPDYRFTVVCINEEGHAVHGTLAFTSRDGAASAVFVPDRGQRHGLDCDLYTFDEAAQLMVHLMPDMPDLTYHYVPVDDSGHINASDTS